MDVFLLSIYLCVTIPDPDVAEQKCRWLQADYFDHHEDCVDAAKAFKDNIPEDWDKIEAYCLSVKVL